MKAKDIRNAIKKAQTVSAEAFYMGFYCEESITKVAALNAFKGYTPEQETGYTATTNDGNVFIEIEK